MFYFIDGAMNERGIRQILREYCSETVSHLAGF